MRVSVTFLIMVLVMLLSCAAPVSEKPPAILQTTTSTPPEIPAKPSTPAPSSPAQPSPSPKPPTPSLTEPVSWFDVKQYTGIPSPDCKPPVTDLKGLPEASVKLTVDTGKTVGKINHDIWAGHIGDGYPTANSELNRFTWEFIRDTRIFTYTRAVDIFSDGFFKQQIDSAKKILEEGKLAADRVFPLYEYYNTRYVYSEDEKGNPQYNFWFLDTMLDIFVSSGVKPIMQLEYMPNDLVEESIKVRWFGGGLINVPKDYNKWRELCYQTAKHCIERYGVEEVRSWCFTVREEPDCSFYFIDGPDCSIEGDYYSLGQCPDREVTPAKGSMDSYLKMYDYFADGIKAADKQLKVGGPNIAFHDWFRPFLEHCVNGTNFATNGKGAPLDTIFWHSYGPIDYHLNNFAKKEKIIQQYPSLKDVPTIIDEWGQVLLKKQSGNYIPCEMCESNFTNYDAAYICRFIDGIVNDPSNNPSCFMRYGSLNKSTGLNRYMSITDKNYFINYFIPMPILNTYIVLAKMGGDRVDLSGSNVGDLIHGFASKTTNGVQVLVYNFDEQNEKGTGDVSEINLTLTSLPKEWTKMKRYQIDSITSNAWANHPVDKSFKTNDEYTQAQEDSKLKIIEQTDKLAVINGQVTFRLSLPPNSVSLVVIGEEAVPPKTTITPHIERVLQEEKAYKAAQAKLKAGDLNGARASFEQLVRESYQASGLNTKPYSIWGQKAHFMLLYVAVRQNDNVSADAIRANLLKTTTLNDVERFLLINDRIKYMESAGKKDEMELLIKQLEPVKSKLEYLANWTRWRTWGAEAEYTNYNDR